MSSISYCCPYFVGAEFFLLLTSSIDGSGGQSTTPIRVRVVELFPFTQSQTMKVAVLEHAELPPIVILKLYDRRYLEERGPGGKSKAIWSHEKEREAAETDREYDRTSALVTTTAEEEVDLDCEEEDGYESDISEIEFAYQIASADAPVTQWLIEERFRHRTSDWYHAETKAYERLQHFQQWCLPRFFGSVEFDQTRLRDMALGIHTEVRGIFLEFIDGITVDKIPAGSPLTLAYPTDGNDVVRCFTQINAAGVIHGDLRLENLILRDGRIFIVDFAHAKFRNPQDSDDRWNRRISYEREPSAISDFIGRVFPPALVTGI